MLTKDRVTIRVNISAEYRVADPVVAASTVKDFQEALYRSLQYAYRKALGSLTLDHGRPGEIAMEYSPKVDDIANQVYPDPPFRPEIPFPLSAGLLGFLPRCRCLC
jgi:regulator of protease activity HflC (stomatin/prohibitin superfamily)